MNIHVNDHANALPVGTWRLDPDRTTITVTATKLGFFSVPATLAVSAGTIEIGTDEQVAAVEVIADAGSYTSRNDKRNDHVRSADFLDSDNHPELVFRAETISPVDAGYRAVGSVAVKGQRSPLSIDVTDLEVDAGHGSLTATATVDRNAIGVGKFPSFIIGRRLEISATVHAVRADA
ncbi:MAG: YceI family protein [Actinomycetota bacterium]